MEYNFPLLPLSTGERCRIWRYLSLGKRGEEMTISLKSIDYSTGEVKVDTSIGIERSFWLTFHPFHLFSLPPIRLPGGCILPQEGNQLWVIEKEKEKNEK